MGSNPDLQAAELALNGGPGRGGPALGPARSPLGPRALRPPSCPRPGRSGRLQEAGPADGRGEAKGPRNRGGVEARNGRGWERSPSPRVRTRADGCLVPQEGAELRPGSPNCKMAKGKREGGSEKSEQSTGQAPLKSTKETIHSGAGEDVS